MSITYSNLLTEASNYLIGHAQTDPSYWNDHFPYFFEGDLITKEGTCDIILKGKLTHLFQDAMAQLQKSSPQGFSFEKLQCRQGVASLMYGGIGLTLDLTPLDDSALYIKSEDLKITVPTEKIRKLEFFKDILLEDYKEFNNVVSVPNLGSEETWNLYFSEELDQKDWTKKFYNNPYKLIELLHIADYFNDKNITKNCSDPFFNLDEPLFEHDDERLPKFVHMLVQSPLQESLKNSIIAFALYLPPLKLLSFINKMEDQGYAKDLHAITELYLPTDKSLYKQKFNDELDRIASFFPNVKKLSIETFYCKSVTTGNLYTTWKEIHSATDVSYWGSTQFSHIPEIWKKNLTHLYFYGCKSAVDLAGFNLDDMPNLEHLEGTSIKPKNCPKLTQVS